MGVTASTRRVLRTTRNDEFGKAYLKLRESLPALPISLRRQVERCLDAIDGDEAVAAVWFLKDASEATARLLFVVGAAEVLRLDPAKGSGWLDEGKGEEKSPFPDSLRDLARFIRYNRFPSFGNLLWHLTHSIVKNARVAGPASASALLAELWAKGPEYRLVQLKAWRNDFHGHGALGNAENAAKNLENNLGHLAKIFESLAPLWPKLTAAAEAVLAAGPPDGASLRPLLELLDGPENVPRQMWIFDSADEAKAQFQYRSALDLTARKVSRAEIAGPELQAVETLAEDPEWRGRPMTVDPGAGGLETGWLQHVVDLRFAGYDKGVYTEPKYLRREVEARLDSRTSGAERIVGPAGSGKSFLVRGLVDRWRNQLGEGNRRRKDEEEAEGRNWVILPYFAVPGRGAEENFFINRVFREFGKEEERLKKGRGGYLTLPDPGQPPSGNGLGEWLKELATLNPGIDRIILIVDGLDEIRPASGQAALTAFLPLVLPDRVFLLLSGRDDAEIHPDVRRNLAEMPFGGGGPIRIVTDVSDPRSAANGAILRSYLTNRYPELKAQISRVIEAAEGRFLYVETLARGIREGAFSARGALPTPGEIVVRYVGWLVSRMHAFPAYGRALEQTIAFLAAAVMPVPMECLVDWGIDERWIEEILLDLKGVVVRERQSETALVKGLVEPYTYRLFHRDVVEHLAKDAEWAGRVAEARRTILERIVGDRRGRWDDETVVSWDNPADSYAMLGLAGHVLSVDERVLEEIGIPAGDCNDTAWRLVVRARYLRRTLLQPEGAFQCLKEGRALAQLSCAENGAEPSEAASARLRSAIASGFSSVYLDLRQHNQAAIESQRSEAIARELLDRYGRTPQALRDLSISLNHVANVLLAEGERAGAREKYEECEAIRRELLDRYGRTPEALRDLSISLDHVADVLLAEGNRAGAREKYEECEAIRRELLDRYGRTPEALRDVSISLDRVADVLLAEGNRAGAREKYKESEAIRHELLDVYGRTPEALRDLSISLDRVADVLLAEGERAGAREKYEESEAIARDLLDRYGRTPQALRDLSFSLDHVANVLLAEGERAGAREKYEEFEAIARELLDRYGRTPQALRDLSISLNHVANVLLAEGERAGAREKYEEFEAIARELLERYGRTPEALSDLSVSLNHVANVLLAEGERAGAREKYEESEAIARELVERYGRTPEALRDLSISLDHVADVLLAEGNRAGAREKYEECEAIRRELLDRYGRTPEALRDLSFSLDHVADVLLAEGNRAGAREKYEECEAIRRELVERYGRTPEALRDLSISLDHVANVLLAEGERAGAREKYEEFEAITRELVDRYGRTPQALRDLSVSLNNVAGVLLAEGERAGAREKYGESEAIARELLERYGRTPDALSVLSSILNSVVEEILLEKDGAVALTKSLEAEEMGRELLKGSWPQSESCRILSESLDRTAKALILRGDREGALEKCEEALAILRSCHADDPANRQTSLEMAFGLAVLHQADARRVDVLEEARTILRDLAASGPRDDKFWKVAKEAGMTFPPGGSEVPS
jgi:tetratricopeptide (TPR) repeat protein